ncbi:FHA domain-containing protein [Bdellovibrionota bacterium FG-2]
MFKLTVVAGPNRGSTYAVKEGETSIGRQSGNSIILSSSKISKRHCVFLLEGAQIAIRDEGSSNGTFVNGALTKFRKLKTGDRVTVGDFTFELTETIKRAARPVSVAGFSSGLQFPDMGGRGGGGAQSMISGMPVGGGASAVHTLEGPGKDFKSKLNWYFDQHVMPIFYGLHMKHQWRFVCVAIFSAFVLGTLLFTIQPLIEANRSTIIKETLKRASFMAREIAQRNAPYLAARAETKTEVGVAETAEGVRVAVLTDLDNRILAPAVRMNQYLNGGEESVLAVKARDLFRKGRETGISQGDSSLVIAVEPVKILNPQLAKNVVVGMAVVSIDTSIATPDLGEVGMVYSEALILTGILGGLALLILYRLTLKPFLILNEDMDKALKGEIPQVTQEFKFEELSSLWENINAAIQRIPKGAQNTGMGLGGGDEVSLVDQVIGPMRMLGNVSKLGLVVCDAHHKIQYLNSMFEEISGIRESGSVGQDFASVARDQSLGIFLKDLFERAAVGSDGISEDYDFSGITYTVHVAAYGVGGNAPKGYLITTTRNEG